MKRDYFFDYLRAAATLGVIVWHSVSPVYYQFGPIGEWGVANILFGCAIRWSVASFVMISGALLLDKEEPPPLFYKKRLLRICIPLVAWTIIYGLARLYYFKVYTYTNLPKPSFFQFVVLGQFRDLLFDRLSYHLYFVSLILGLYAITPYLGKMVRALHRKELEAFLAIGICLCSLKAFFPSLLVLDRLQVGSYFFYYILGYYLYKFPMEKSRRLLFYTVGIFAAILMTWLNYYMEYLHKDHKDIVYDSEGIFVYAITIAVFVFFRQMFSRPGSGSSWGGRLALFMSSNSYGMYIAHPLVISFLLYGGFSSFSFSTAVCNFSLFGHRFTLMMNNAWGAVVQALIVTVVLLILFFLLRTLRLQRYFT